MKEGLTLWPVAQAGTQQLSGVPGGRAGRQPSPRSGIRRACCDDVYSGTRRRTQLDEARTDPASERHGPTVRLGLAFAPDPELCSYPSLSSSPSPHPNPNPSPSASHSSHLAPAQAPAQALALALAQALAQALALALTLTRRLTQPGSLAERRQALRSSGGTIYFLAWLP